MSLFIRSQTDGIYVDRLDYSRPDKGWGWFSLYRISGYAELEGFRPADHDLVLVYRPYYEDVGWYVRKTLAAPFLVGAFWLWQQRWHPLRWLYRLGVFTLPEYECFTWKRFWQTLTLNPNCWRERRVARSV